MEVLDHECPSCGANLPFNPKSQKWDCIYCGSSYTLEQLKEIEEKAQKTSDDEALVNEYTCSNCGANIVTDENTSATFCVYCGSTSIIKSRFKGAFMPDKIIPFKNTKEQAIQKFIKFSKGKIFSPKNFTDVKNIEKITGVYIPFWMYDCDVEGSISAKANKVKTWRSGDYVYTKTDKYLATRSGVMSYSKVPVDGAKKFDDNTMDSIEPFDYNELKDFNMSYLSGFLAEKYDLGKEDAKQRAYFRMQNSSRDVLKSTITGYSSVIVDDSKFNMIDKKIDYMLLPVWMLNIKYKDKLHFFAMNGQTGKMVGNIPIDKKKATLISLIFFVGSTILISIIVFIISLFM